MMTLIMTTHEHGVKLTLSGNLYGTVAADNIEDACYKLLKHLSKNDIVYIIVADKLSIEVAKVLERYVTVVPIDSNTMTKIDETFDIGTIPPQYINYCTTEHQAQNVQEDL